VGAESLLSEIHKLIKFMWDKGELPLQWKETIVLPIHKKGDKSDCSNYRAISFLLTSYTILLHILPSGLPPYSDGVIGDHNCGFWRNRSKADQIFYIRQIPEKYGSVMVQYITYL
jgi:hypothetical protein